MEFSDLVDTRSKNRPYALADPLPYMPVPSLDTTPPRRSLCFGRHTFSSSIDPYGSLILFGAGPDLCHLSGRHIHVREFFSNLWPSPAKLCIGGKYGSKVAGQVAGAIGSFGRLPGFKRTLRGIQCLP